MPLSKIYFIHGITGSKHNFDALQKYFPDSESFDLPGFASDAKAATLYDKAFYLQFLETKISQPAVLVGHSMGSILAKDFALAHPELVQQLFLISYPMQKDAVTFETNIISDPLTRGLLSTNDRTYKFANRFNQATKYISLPAVWLFKRNLYLSLRDSYYFTRDSLRGAIHNVILNDDYHTISQLQAKYLLIVGELDPRVDKSLVTDFNFRLIKRMRHTFFGFEPEIAAIIKGQ